MGHRKPSFTRRLRQSISESRIKQPADPNLKKEVKLGPDGKLLHPSPFKAGRNIGVYRIERDNPIRPLSNQLGRDDSTSPRRRDCEQSNDI